MSNRLKNLREIHGQPSKRSSEKVCSYLKDEIQDFIKLSPFAVLSSCDDQGNCDASPRGGLPGFVKIIDDMTLFIPDIKGNRLFQSFGNFESNPKSGLLFMIPGINRTMRVNGRVSIVEKEDIESKKLEAYYKDENTELIQGFFLHVDEAYHQCSRSLQFSDLWNTETIIKNQK